MLQAVFVAHESGSALLVVFKNISGIATSQTHDYLRQFELLLVLHENVIFELFHMQIRINFRLVPSVST